MFKVHQGKYSFINKHQDNFALLALLTLLNPSAETEWSLQAQIPQHLGADSPSGTKTKKPEPVIHQVAFFL